MQVTSTHRSIVAFDYTWYRNRSSTGKHTIFLEDSVRLGHAGRYRRQQMDRLVVLPADEIYLLVFALDRHSYAANIRPTAAPFPLPSLGNSLSLGRPFLLGLTVPNKWMPHSSRVHIKKRAVYQFSVVTTSPMLKNIGKFSNFSTGHSVALTLLSLSPSFPLHGMNLNRYLVWGQQSP